LSRGRTPLDLIPSNRNNINLNNMHTTNINIEVYTLIGFQNMKLTYTYTFNNQITYIFNKVTNKSYQLRGLHF